MSKIQRNTIYEVCFILLILCLFGVMASAATQGVPLFRVVPQYSFANGAFALAAGDFNEDGNVDVAGAAGSKQLTISLGSGAGGFQRKGHYTVPAGVGELIAADFNNDGHLDLATIGFNAVSVMLGNGDGTFVAGPVLSNNSVESIAAGDLNGDGIVDLVSYNTNANASTLNTFLGNGDASFQTVATYHVSSGNGGSAVVLADFNRDGHRDAVLTNVDVDTITIFPGNGDGTLGPRSSYPAGSGPFDVGAADLDGDGILDLAVADFKGTTVSILHGNGDGSFAAAVAYTTGSAPEHLVIADFDNDGKLDIGTANASDQNLSVLRGLGNGKFSPPTYYGPGPGMLVAADFNNDGRADLALPDDAFRNGVDTGVLSVLLATPQGTLQRQWNTRFKIRRMRSPAQTSMATGRRTLRLRAPTLP